jgi:hypothetical protein
MQDAPYARPNRIKGFKMGRRSCDAYDNALGLHEAETDVADSFEVAFPIVTGRPVKILSAGESPDRIALWTGSRPASN